MEQRRSVREYASRDVSLEAVAQLLWAAQGVTGVGGLRTAPSAGALFPLRAYLAAIHVAGLASGTYRYDPDTHELEPLSKGDKSRLLRVGALGQECAGQCAVAVLLTAYHRRLVAEFGAAAAHRLAAMEAGHAGQNFLLQAGAAGLGAIGLGRIDADVLRSAFSVPPVEEPLYLLLAGHKRIEG